VQIAHLEFQLDDSVLTQRILRLRVGAEDVSRAMDRVAKKIQPEVSVPGFRKGKGPTHLIRKHFGGRISAEVIEELKRAALEQVLPQVKEEDKPFIPPDLLDRDNIRLRYGQPLEFAIRYLVDPSARDSQPEAKHDEFDPLSGLHQQNSRSLPTGVPGGPRLPSAPSSQTGLPKQPQ
jgi:FKBP-type peptidyl-prolyl cis-trans isomerase (trigger factor)